VVSIPSPRERHDAFVIETVTPVVRELHASPALVAVWFERVNKPEWGIQVHLAGEPSWLEGQGRATLIAGLGIANEAATLAEELDDKWSGSRDEQVFLRPFHHHDTRACLDALEMERTDRLGSRVQYSLLVVEGLLNLFDLQGDDRLAFYRRSFEWAIDAGRWDAEVIASLESTFVRQAGALTEVIDLLDDAQTGPWPSSEAERIGRDLLESARGALPSSELDPSALALSAARAHSNRLGLHASREAALRYLVWRARGGAAISR